MSNISLTELEYNKFVTITRKVTRTDRSTVPTTLNRYREEVVTAYNGFLVFANSIYQQLSRGSQSTLDNRVEQSRDLLERCLNILECKYELPSDIFEQVELDKISNVPNFLENSDTTIEETNQDAKSTSTSSDITPENNSQENDHKESEHGSNHDSNDNSDIESEPDLNTDKMTDVETLRMVNSQLGSTYSGDPTTLESFIDSITLLDEIIDEKKALLVKIIKAKLTGRAREALSSTDDTVAKIIKSLRDNISQESSKVIQGRFTALHLSKNLKLDEFSKKVEELAESLQRSLIAEQFPEAKARQLAVEKTIEVCRANSRSDVIKAVLSSPAGFKNPQEVVATFLTQVGIARSEHQVAQNRQNASKNRQNNNGNNKNGNRYNNNKNGQNRNGHGQNRNGQNKNNGQNNGQNRNGNGQNNGNGGYRNGNGNGHNNNGQNSRSVHYTHAGNSDAPQEHLGVQ